MSALRVVACGALIVLVAACAEMASGEAPADARTMIADESVRDWCRAEVLKPDLQAELCL